MKKKQECGVGRLFVRLPTPSPQNFKGVSLLPEKNLKISKNFLRGEHVLIEFLITITHKLQTIS